MASLYILNILYILNKHIVTIESIMYISYIYIYIYMQLGKERIGGGMVVMVVMVVIMVVVVMG